MAILRSIELMDRQFSGKVHMLNTFPLEVILIVPARMFNRMYALSGILLSFIVGALRYDEMLYQLRYKAMRNPVDN